MAAQDELFQLIKSLTPSEKRYFKVNGDSKSNYMQLFDAIDKQKEEYDEDLLKKKNAKKAFAKYLSAEKKQLREQIMKHMRAFHAGRSIDNQINDLLQDETFYRNKGLNSLRETVLLRAKELATKYERFNLLNEILSRQIVYVIEFEKKRITEPVTKLINEQKQIAIIQETALELQAKNRELFSIHRSGADIQDENVSNRATMLLLEIQKHRTKIGSWFSLGTMFHRGQSNYYQILQNWNKSFESTKFEYELYQSHPQFKDQDSNNYKICLANLISRSNSANQHDWFITALEELKTAPVNSFNEEGEVFQNVYFQEHLFYINHGKFAKAEALVPEIEKGLDKYESKINKARYLTFVYNIMIMYFVMHKFSEAAKWAERILDDKSELKQGLKTATRILFPVIHYELGHYDIVDNLARSAYRHLKEKKRIHRFEKLMISYLHNLPFSEDTLDFTNRLTEFSKDLSELLSNNEFAFGMEEMRIWSTAKIKDIKMEKVIADL